MSTLLFPTLLGFTALVVLTTALRLPAGRRREFLREAAIVLVAYFVYFLVRGATEGSAEEAIRRALALQELEDSLHIGIEAGVQALVLESLLLVDLANAIYIGMHWPLIGVIAIWLFTRRRPRYVVYRNTMLLSGIVGVVVFATLPTAPPRLADPAFVDTVVQHSDAYRVMQPPQLTNQYAAMPSLHFGWNLLMGIALVRESRWLWVRTIGWITPPLMLLAMVATANHYLLDAVAGGALVVLALLVAEGLCSRLDLVRQTREALG